MMMPKESYFAAFMRKMDIRLSDKVVCYDAGERNIFGYRVAWMLNAMGHDNV